MGVLSIQSHVACGRVGNAIVAFALQRLSVEVWQVHTVLFSSHPGHGRHRGKVRAPDDLAEIVAGLEDQGVFERCDAVLGGYLGSAETGAVLLDAVARVRARNPSARFFLDPVMGDASKGLYVPEALVSFYRGALSQADVLAPNAFELGVLTGADIRSPGEAADAARTLMSERLETVFVTSVATARDEEIATLAVSKTDALSVSTPRLGADPKGAGDLFMALVARELAIENAGLADALESAVAVVWSLTEAAMAIADDGDLPVVGCQHVLIEPPRRFTASPV